MPTVAIAKVGLPAIVVARARQAGSPTYSFLYSIQEDMSESRRKLAAIMFTDIVGYTALMGSDEDRAFEVLGKNREIHSKLIEQFNGALIKEMGDGMLIIFDLASEAVRCAIEIQMASKNRIFH